MTRDFGFTIEEDSIGPHLQYLVLHGRRNVTSYLRRQAVAVEVYMKANAPWEDRTGQARATVGTDVYDDDGEIVMELHHGVSYGQWLELIQGGRFAIIGPTLEALGDRIAKGALQGMLRGTEYGGIL